MLTEQRQKAIRTVRAALGLNDRPSSWTFEQRSAYNKALAAYILQNPEGFNDVSINTAERVAKMPFVPLEDTSFDWAMFATEASAPVVAIGEGVKNTATASRWLIPAAAIAAVLILLSALAVRTGAARARQF